MFRLSLGLFGDLGDADLGQDRLGGGHPLPGRHEHLGDEVAANWILTNTNCRLRDDLSERERLANGIGWSFDRDHVSQVFAENPPNLLIVDVQRVQSGFNRVVGHPKLLSAHIRCRAILLNEEQFTVKKTEVRELFVQAMVARAQVVSRRDRLANLLAERVRRPL